MWFATVTIYGKVYVTVYVSHYNTQFWGLRTVARVGLRGGVRLSGTIAGA